MSSAAAPEAGIVEKYPLKIQSVWLEMYPPPVVPAAVITYGAASGYVLVSGGHFPTPYR